jgi:hypothetical protein
MPVAGIAYAKDGDLTRPSLILAVGVSTEELDYDAEGRLESRRTIFADHPGRPPEIDYIYDAIDRLESVRYPAQYGTPRAPRPLVGYQYDLGGRVRAITVDGT